MEFFPHKILMVEDDEIDQMAFFRYIKQEGLPYTYEIAGTVKDAVKLLGQEPGFDVIISDYMLPDGTAFDIFDAVDDNTPIIFVTGEGDQKTAVKAIKSGAYDYLIKDNQRDYLNYLPITIENAVKHKEANEKLEAAEEELEKLSWVASKTDNGVMITDEKGRIEWVNDGFERLTGYSLEDIKGTSAEVLRKGKLTGLSPDSSYFKKLKKEKKSVAYEVKNYNKKGDPYWILTTLTPILNEKGNIQNVIAIDSDITEKKRADQKLKETTTRLITLIDNLVAGVLFEDESRKVVHINTTFCEMFELGNTMKTFLDKPVSVLSKKTKNCFQNPEKFIREAQKLLKNRKINLNKEVGLKGNRTFEQNYIPVYVNNDFKGHLWIYRDITERKKSERELIRAKKSAEASAKAKEQFLANISHEIRTPMNAIVGMAELLKETPLNEQQHDYANTINFASDNLLVLINDILDFTKIESGKIQFESIPFNPRKLVKGVLSTVSFKMSDGKVKLNSDIDEQIPETLVGDPTRLNQILLNLLSNAVKFTKKGEVSVNAKLKKNKNGKVNVEFAVKDTGIGIPKKKLNKIFDVFTQASSDTTRKFGGTGLGLTIVKELVELQKGELNVKSKVNKGSVFSFALDFKKGNKNPKKKKKVDYESNSDSLKGKAVLLVEDNEMNQMLAKTLLEKWNADIEVADNGKIALEKLKEKDYDIVLMDIQMPEVDGYEATKKIRDDLKSDIPVIAMTAHAIKGEENKCKEAGMNDYITKPLKPNKLLKKIQAFFNHN